jgi:hypothetical protein
MADSGSHRIRNRALLVEAMGCWPSFHDSHVLSARRDGDRCEVTVHVFHMTDDVDARGYFVLTHHHRVRMTMSGVSECSLPVGYEADTLFDLLIEGSEGAVTLTFSSVMEQDWRVTCREVFITAVVPCGPRGELAT